MAKIKQLNFFNKPSYFKKTQEEINTLLTDKTLKKGILIIFFLLGLNFLSIALFWIKLPPQLPLFYNRPWGEEQLVSKNGFLILPFSCLVFSIISLRIAGFFYKKEILLSQILVLSSLLICILTNITLIQILFITL